MLVVNIRHTCLEREGRTDGETNLLEEWQSHPRNFKLRVMSSSVNAQSGAGDQWKRVQRQCGPVRWILVVEKLYSTGHLILPLHLEPL